MVNQNEYKRYQTPPILRISSKAFGVGRRLPLVAGMADITVEESIIFSNFVCHSIFYDKTTKQ